MNRVRWTLTEPPVCACSHGGLEDGYRIMMITSGRRVDGKVDGLVLSASVYSRHTFISQF